MIKLQVYLNLDLDQSMLYNGPYTSTRPCLVWINSSFVPSHMATESRYIDYFYCVIFFRYVLACFICFSWQIHSLPPPNWLLLQYLINVSSGQNNISQRGSAYVTRLVLGGNSILPFCCPVWSCAWSQCHSCLIQFCLEFCPVLCLWLPVTLSHGRFMTSYSHFAKISLSHTS